MKTCFKLIRNSYFSYGNNVSWTTYQQLNESSSILSAHCRNFDVARHYRAERVLQIADSQVLLLLWGCFSDVHVIGSWHFDPDLLNYRQSLLLLQWTAFYGSENTTGGTRSRNISFRVFLRPACLLFFSQAVEKYFIGHKLGLLYTMVLIYIFLRFRGSRKTML